jgi:hypothetical protein
VNPKPSWAGPDSTDSTQYTELMETISAQEIAAQQEDRIDAVVRLASWQAKTQPCDGGR